MSWFFLIFLSIYGGMQFFIFWKLRRAFPEMGWWLVLPGLFLLLMLTAPILARRFDRAGWLLAAQITTAVGYTWMAVSFWFLVIGGSVELWNLGARLVALARGAEVRLLVSPRALVGAAGGIILVLILWGIYESSRVRLERITIRTPRLAAGSKPVTVAQVSDLHLGLLGARWRLENALRVAERARPDVLVSTGDMLDTAGPCLEPLARRWAEVKPPLGKFAVLGNHENYSGLEDSLEFYRRAGFRLLRAERELVDERVWICGVDDPAAARRGGGAHLDEDRALPPPEREKFTVLQHRPEVREESLGRFDLQLSGHTHGGQIFPFVLVIRIFHRYVSGLHEFEGGARLYVSRGTGTWGPPLRFLAPPEVTLVTIEPEAAGGRQRPGALRRNSIWAE